MRFLVPARLRLGVAARIAAISTALLSMLAPDLAAASSTEYDRFQSSLAAFVDQLRASPYAPPGFMVVAVHGDLTVFERAYGVRRVGASAPMTLDTPIYNASSTKAYTGLLAAILDDEGVLPLQATLKDVWPSMPSSAAFDASTVTAAALLAHASGIHEGGIQFRSNITGQISVVDIPRRLATYGIKREAEFRYSNFGPYLWSAMAETRTGTAWRDLIARKVFEPLDLKRTVARSEGFPGDEIARCHARWDGRWQELPLKPTPILNAAGGIYTSARDSGRFLKAFLTDGKSAQGRISPAVLRRTWQPQSTQSRDMFGMHRDGYGLGWDLGTFGAHRFVSRSGGTAGCRSMILFLPERQFGVAVSSVGDVGANAFNAAIFGQAIDFWNADPKAETHARTRVTEYAAVAADAFKAADAVYAKIRTAPALDPAIAQAAVGSYENERLGRFEISTEKRVLRLSGGVFTADLIPVGGDNFLVVQPGIPETETFSLIRSPAGAVTAFLWDDDRYDRR